MAIGDRPPASGAAAARTGVAALAGLLSSSVSLLRAERRLRLSLLRWTAAGLLMTEAFAVSVARLDSPGAALWAALEAFGWWALVCSPLVAGAPLLTVPPEGRRIDHYGVPNGLTALRAWAALPLLLVSFLHTPGRVGFFLWFSIGGLMGLLDFADGIIARRVGPVTALGKAIDPAGDALFFGVAAVSGHFLGVIPLWLMALLLLRFIGPLVATPIVLLTRRRPEVVATPWGRRNTAFAGLVIFVLTWVRTFGGPVDAVALAVGLPLLVPTLALHFVALGRRMAAAPVIARGAPS